MKIEGMSGMEKNGIKFRAHDVIERQMDSTRSDRQNHTNTSLHVYYRLRDSPGRSSSGLKCQLVGLVERRNGSGKYKLSKYEKKNIKMNQANQFFFNEKLNH